MSIIYVLIPLAIIIVGIAIVVFFWAVRSNQFEDLDRQGYSILFDDDINTQDKEADQSIVTLNKSNGSDSNESKPSTVDK
ncbi:cbb3-type cytochrome oxidase assembly protein CcoS [Brumicola nitratireducens]|uniref:Cytochrome oxidase maturation protein, cbb3-type n=1 Tax=Glaciecola nitratireducens (strain JCM 12485 / KCTC 12276 / FR1064) TaxID=1085623 RepID=G4QHF2_GLANF|nr:cbb3-type cytochrome oxidase assembly protein CcoS [Glaciecola nitratireducens]AEP29938.1 cytochrome oxidase maturation protein, cbb3-type [Glaciecola nitratireducens FR1064]